MSLRTHLFALSLLGWLFCAELYADQVNLPDIGDSAGAVLSPDQERRIGAEFLRRIRLNFQLVEDPEVNAYINSLGNRLVEHSGYSNQTFTFFVINDLDINAFAAPGGYIGVNSGLILASETESELASVLSHEIAHVTQRHLARAFEAQGKLNVPALAGLIAAIILGSQNSELGQATLAASQGALAQTQIDFTRSNENEADFVGIQTLASANFDPNAMSAFFERLQQASRYYSRPPEFLSTHPVTTSRIANARDRASRYSYRQYPDSLDFHLIREKLNLLSGGVTDPTKYYRALLGSGQYLNQTAVRYAYSLALKKAGQYQQAYEQIDYLLKRYPEKIHFLIARAQLQLQSSQPQRALESFQAALKLYPHDYTLTHFYAEALLELNKPEQARALLHKQRLVRNLDAGFYRLLSVAEGKAGYRLEAHRSLAEYYFLVGQTGDALNQLERALKIKSQDFIELSKVQARRDELKQLLDAERHF